MQPLYAVNLTLNLKGADIAALVETVSEATGKNFILDPKVRGKVTVISTKPMEAQELYQTFLAILDVHGYIAVPSGNVIKIIPNATQKYRGTLSTNSQERVADDEIIIQVYNVEYVDATRLIPALRPLVSPKGHLAAHGAGNMLVVSDHANIVTRLGRIIRRIDQPISGDIEMVQLQHASATELAQLINKLGKSAGLKKSGKKTSVPTAVADERTNSLLIGGDKQVRVRLRAMIAHLDTPVEVSGNTRVVHLRFAKAKELAEVLTSMGKNFIDETKKTTPTLGNLVNVQVYEESNALVLTAPATLLKTMEGVIRRLDVRRAQVQVEAIIAEVKTDLLANLGVEWGVLTGGGSKKGVGIGTNLGNGLFALSGSLMTKDRNKTAEAAANLTGVLVGGTNLDNLAVLLRAIKSDANTNILSTPSLVTLDNEEAEIVVGQEVPVRTGSYTNTASGSGSIGSPFQTINRKNVGITLRVTPQINEGDTILLELVQEASSLAPTPSSLSLSDVLTNTRSINTTVLVDNGQILALGGLIENKVSKSTFKVPLLGDIPYLGTLFRAETKNNYQTNLMVFLRPTIIRNRGDSLSFTRRKYNRVRQQQLAIPESWNPMFRDGSTPLLPKLDTYLRHTSGVQPTAVVTATKPESAADRLAMEELQAGKPMIQKPPHHSGPVSDSTEDQPMADEEDYVH